MATVVHSIIEPDVGAIKAHLAVLFAPCVEHYPQGLIELRHGPSFQSAYFGIHTRGLEDAAAFAADRARAGSNVYVGVNPRRHNTDLKGGASAADIEVAFFHFADLDDADAVAAVGRRLKALPPTFTVTTGTVPHRRPHLYWQLEEPVANLAAWSERQQGIAQSLDGDKVIDPPRIMRLAGTVNWPDQKKLQRGYKAELVTIKTAFEDDREPVTPEQVAAAFPRRDELSGISGQLPREGETTLSAMRGTQIADLIAACRSGDAWHNNMIRLVAHLAAKGRTSAEIVALADHITLPGYSVEQTAREMVTALQGARQKFGFEEPADTVETEEAARTTSLKATPFVWRAEDAIPPRKWLYGRHLLRRFLSVDIAGGGVGKSSLKIGEALAMASNRALYGKEVYEGPLRVWLYNLEDPAEESERRLHATAKRFAITPADVDGQLFVDSGRDQPCILAEETREGVRIMAPVVEAIIAEIKARKIDVLVIDPFVSSHDVSENDNKAIDKVAKQWARIADICDCSINLVHHVRKQNGAEATADSARGAKALTDAARSVHVYNRMSKDEAEAAGITPEEAAFIFRVQNDKANLSPPERAEWYRMNNTDLDNGDKVGVACPWQWPDPFDGVTLTHLRAVQTLIGKDDYREDVRAAKWAGNAVAEVLNIEPSDKANRKRITSILKEWIRNGALEVVDTEDEHRKARKQVIVGKWAGE